MDSHKRRTRPAALKLVAQCYPSARIFAGSPEQGYEAFESAGGHTVAQLWYIGGDAPYIEVNIY